MKKTLFMFLLFMGIYPFGTIKLYSQVYLNIKYTNSTYKYSLVSEVSEITFNAGNAGGTEMTVTKTDASTTTDNLSTIVEMTFDASILGGGSPLPVELVSFTAKLNENPRWITLLWTTATEVNNYGFEIARLRSPNSAEASWKTLGFVAGHGNSNSPNKYSYTDKEPFGGSSFDYRLKQIDVDGNYKYSNIITVKVTPDQFSLNQNYPNPFNPSTTIEYQLPQKGFVTLKIYDIRGSEVAILVNEQQGPGKYNVEWNAGNYSSGVYIYKLTFNEFTSNKKLLLIK